MQESYRSQFLREMLTYIITNAFINFFYINDFLKDIISLHICGS